MHRAETKPVNLFSNPHSLAQEHWRHANIFQFGVMSGNMQTTYSIYSKGDRETSAALIRGHCRRVFILWMAFVCTQSFAPIKACHWTPRNRNTASVNKKAPSTKIRGAWRKVAFKHLCLVDVLSVVLPTVFPARALVALIRSYSINYTCNFSATERTRTKLQTGGSTNFRLPTFASEELA